MVLLGVILVIALVDCGGPPQVATPPCTPVTWFVDADADGFGGEAAAESCDQPPNMVFQSGDCDDGDPFVFPGAFDACNGEDDDCDESFDEDSPPPTWYLDDDGDGFGDPGAPTVACVAPADHVADATDCDDTDAAVNPLGTERCDGVDEDCDGAIDDDPEDGVIVAADADGDGYGAIGATERVCDGQGPAEGGDCDDTRAAVNPGATEACNGLDDDCANGVDDGFPTSPFWPDQDQDGWGDDFASPAQACAAPPNHADVDGDCDDSSSVAYPGAPELCNAEDDDCDGLVDEDQPDADGDGFTACDGDCDDTRADVNPDGVEICDALDNDCSGVFNDPWRDPFEPNDERQLGPQICGDNQEVVVTANVSGPDDAFDWFEMFTVDDADPAFSDSFGAWAQVDGIPAGVEMGLHLWRNDVFGQANLVDSDFSWQDGSLSVFRGGVWASNDGNRYFIQVERLDGFACEEEYTLTVGNGG